MASVVEQKRILIVEDDQSIATILVDALKSDGYTTNVASSGDDAIQQLTKFDPHLILTDYEMPGFTGLDMLKELRQKENYVTVIFVSGRTDSNLIVESFKSGADDYIKKPFRIPELLARVEASLRTNELHDELMRANNKLQSLVEQDYLTGLYNMKSMYDKIDHELKRAKRFNRPVTCVMLDMDHFKTVNDDNDHLFGSFVLKETGRIIQENIREIDYAARYGGDEFLVVLTETERDGVEVFCERLRSAIEDHHFKEGTNQIKLTVSMGYALSKSRDIDARELVRHADNALYQSKEAGRNKVTGMQLIGEN